MKSDRSVAISKVSLLLVVTFDPPKKRDSISCCVVCVRRCLYFLWKSERVNRTSAFYRSDVSELQGIHKHTMAVSQVCSEC